MQKLTNEDKDKYKGTIEYDGGIDLTDQYLAALKKIDPSLKTVKIIMKGDFNRTVDMKF